MDSLALNNTVIRDPELPSRGSPHYDTFGSSFRGDQVADEESASAPRIKVENDPNSDWSSRPRQIRPVFDPSAIPQDMIIDLTSDDEAETCIPQPTKLQTGNVNIDQDESGDIDIDMEELFGPNSEPLGESSPPTSSNSKDSLPHSWDHEEVQAGVTTDVADDEDDDLFVSQPGDYSGHDGDEIDLTEEPEEISQARHARVNFNDQEAIQIKIEEREKPGGLDPVANVSASNALRNDGKRPDFRGHDWNENANDEDFQADENEQLSDGERPRKRQRHPKQKKATNGGGKDGNQNFHEVLRNLLKELMTEQVCLEQKSKSQLLSPRERVRLLEVGLEIKQVFNTIEQNNDKGNAQVKSNVRLGNTTEVEDSAHDFVHAQAAPRSKNNEVEGETAGASAHPPKQTRTPPAKTAKEYWERQYKAASLGDFDAQTLVKKSKAAPKPAPSSKTSRSWWDSPASSAKKSNECRDRNLVQLLRDNDPITARAAMGAVHLPGPIPTKNKADQIKQIKHNIAENPGADKSIKKNTQYQMRLLKEATKSFGARQCTNDHGKWKVPGMKTSLYHHQLVGVRWMLGQEFSPNGPFGGILADQMGLGKTVQVLATMTNNPPSVEVKGQLMGATLIVVPSATIPQWIDEIIKHTELTLIHYRSSVFKKQPNSAWSDKDIVITTYQEVAKAHPSEEKLKRFASMSLNNEDWGKEFDTVLGDLYRVKFHRVILDEAHAIKNQHSRTSKACVALSAKHRWALTGTPIQNSIDELYPYMRFIGADWAAEDFETFKRNFGDIEDDTVQARLAAFVPSIMLRRRVDETFAGRPILEIPRTHKPDVQYIDLSIEERLMYQRLESRFRDNINQHIKDGTARKKTRNYLAYLSRLRQAVAHPFLLEVPMINDFTLEDLTWLRDELKEIGGNIPLYQQIQEWIPMEFESRKGDEGGTASFGISQFGYYFNMDPQLEKIHRSKKLDDIICRFCYDLPTEPVLAECGHTYCTDCLQSMFYMAQQVGGQCKCRACNAVIKSPRVFAEIPDGDKDFEAGIGSQGKKRKKKDEHQPGDDELWAQPKSNPPSTWLDHSDNNPSQGLTPGSKTTAVKNKILQWQREAPDDKIIIFTQWVLMARVLGRIIAGEHIKFLYYFGSMTPSQRNDAIKAFRQDPRIKVLIASVKCGGQALNMTCANRVILTDLWWNTAIERQAFGRVHRIGQEKETHFCKIVCKNTIDERLLDMQEDKDKFIARTLNDDMSIAAKNITFEDLKTLFQTSDGDQDNEITDAGSEAGLEAVLRDDNANPAADQSGDGQPTSVSQQAQHDQATEDNGDGEDGDIG